MEINLVVLNVGNSRLGIGTFIAGEPGPVTRLTHAQRDAWSDQIAEAWKLIGGRDNAAIVASGVHPAMERAVDDIVADVASRRIVWVGKDLDLPIKVLTDEPDQTGVDRVLNVAAAFEQLEHACVVVDAGTAITIDICNDEGDFVGGAIAPGLDMQLDALHERTAKLPRVDFAIPSQGVGRSTAEAIRHGVYHGVRGMVREIVENHATELGRWPEVIATGGDANRLFSGWELIHAISPDLTFFGVALAYAKHHMKDEAE